MSLTSEGAESSIVQEALSRERFLLCVPKMEIPCSRPSCSHLPPPHCGVHPSPHTQWILTEPVVGGSGVVFRLTEIMSGVLLPSRKQLLIKEELFGWAGTVVFH